MTAAPRKRRTAKGWAIAHKGGLYQGWWLTRRQAIEQHCADTGCGWDYCQSRRGDYAVRVTITEASRGR